MGPGSRSLRSLVRTTGINVPELPFQTSQRRSFAFPRRDAPEPCMKDSPLKNRGRGECRVPNAPAASRARWEVSTRASSPKVHRVHPAFPHAMVLTAYFALSPAIGLVCHRHLRFWRRLDAGVEASGPHDFAVRVSIVRQPALPASTASRPASVTIAIRPLCGAGRQRI
jgi:hypothetical protein